MSPKTLIPHEHNKLPAKEILKKKKNSHKFTPKFKNPFIQFLCHTTSLPQTFTCQLLSKSNPPIHTTHQSAQFHNFEKDPFQIHANYLQTKEHRSFNKTCNISPRNLKGGKGKDKRIRKRLKERERRKNKKGASPKEFPPCIMQTITT